MKMLSIVLSSLLSVSCLVGMEDSLFDTEQDIMDLAILLFEGRSKCACKKMAMEARRKRYIQNGSAQHVDESCLDKQAAKLSYQETPADILASLKGDAINKPDADGVLPLQKVLQAGNFNLALRMLEGSYHVPAHVKLNFAQKAKNPFVKTMIVSLTQAMHHAHSECTNAQECISDKPFIRYQGMNAAILLNKLLQNGASTDFHGTTYGNNQVRDLAKFAQENKFNDLAKLITLNREQNHAAMNELVLMIKDETLQVCKDAQ